MSKYSAFEKAILGVRTDKDVEECHKKREQNRIESLKPKKFLLIKCPNTSFVAKITMFKDEDSKEQWKKHYSHCKYIGERSYEEQMRLQEKFDKKEEPKSVITKQTKLI